VYFGCCFLGGIVCGLLSVFGSLLYLLLWLFGVVFGLLSYYNSVAVILF